MMSLMIENGGRLGTVCKCKYLSAMLSLTVYPWLCNILVT